jgi:hypothetical protein
MLITSTIVFVRRDRGLDYQVVAQIIDIGARHG